MTADARDVLLEAAFRAFLAHGYDGAGISDILKGTGLSRGTIYHYHANKLALFDAVVARYLPFPFESWDWAAHEARDASEQRAAIASLYDATEAEMSAFGGSTRDRYFALFFDALSHLPAFRRSVATGYARLIAALAEAEKRGGAETSEAEVLARSYVAAFEGEIYLKAVLAGAAQDKE